MVIIDEASDCLAEQQRVDVPEVVRVMGHDNSAIAELMYYSVDPFWN